MTKGEANKRSVFWNVIGHLKRLAKTFWRGTTIARQAAANIVFLAIIVAVLGLLMYDDSPKFSDKTALVVSPVGTFVEQKSAKSADPLGTLMSGGSKETLLRDVLETIESAQDDDRVNVLVLDLGKMGGAGLSKLQEVAAAITRFKESGKQVIAVADSYSQGAYYVAAHADEIHLHNMGGVSIQGFGRYQMYYRDALDRLEVDWNVFRVGKYKSAVEPYLSNEMSDAAREANLEWMGDLWDAYLLDVATAREIDIAQVRDFANNYDRKIKAVRGDSAQAALDAGLVDHVGGRDAVRDRLVELVGENEETHNYNQVGGSAYLAHVRDRKSADDPSDPAVAVVVARGTIMDGKQPAGAIGGDSTAALVRKARLDEKVKAIVLRVDSGGGSAFASEVIRREFELARDAGKKVVVSMGSVAASGGYWISTASDEIWASPTTITGSIGIFGMFPTFQKPLANRLGVRVDGVATAPFAGAMRSDRALNSRVAEQIQTEIEHGYQEFLERVSAARDMTTDEVHEIAQGRVWSGEDAHDAGLVDQLGGLRDAIASAAAMAELGEDFRVAYIESDKGVRDQVIESFLGAGVEHLANEYRLGLLGGGHNALSDLLGVLEEHARVLASFNDPRGVYAHSMIDVD